MNILDIITKKRDNKMLSKEEIEYFVKNYTNGKIPDYQASALLMAIYLNGMNEQETTDLTIAMANSGEVLDLSPISSIIVDKHSTGGVGDKVSIILLPIIASLGVDIAKMSGRGLSFTGGTADKMDSIPGYKTEVSIDTFIEDIKKVGISMITQTMNIAPADKKIYALRDTICCVESIPLIASSIMSKKIASGANKIVIDVTIGEGAFMKDIIQGRLLAEEMIKIGKLANRETICVLTNMDEPLGYSVGNNLEVIEAVEALKGKISNDVKEVILELGAYMLKLAGISNDLKNNKILILENINNGKAYNKFLEMVHNQGGDISYIEDLNKFEKSKYIQEVYSKTDGIIQKINAKEIGIIARDLGAGRIKKEDPIDYTAGIILNKKIGDPVKKGELIAKIHCNDKNKISEAGEQLLKVIEINNNKVLNKKIVLRVVE